MKTQLVQMRKPRQARAGATERAMESGFPLEEHAARRLFLREGSALLTGQIVSLVMNVGVAPALPSPQHSLVWAAGWAAGRFGSSWNRQGLAASVHMAAQPCAVRGQTMPPVWEVHQFLAQQCQDLISQTSSPLSQNDSCTGRSADLLLPSADTSRRRHDSLPDPGTASRADRFRVQVIRRVSIGRGHPWAAFSARSSATCPLHPYPELGEAWGLQKL